MSSEDPNHLVIPEGVKEIGNGAYQGLTMTGITFPNTVTKIGRNAFSNCRNLEEIILPDSVVSIGPLAFDGFQSVRKLVLPGKIKRIEAASFSRCCSLTGVGYFDR